MRNTWHQLSPSARMLLLIAPLFVAGYVWSVIDSYGPEGLWNPIGISEPGPVQVFGNNDELWVFFEVSTYERQREFLSLPCPRLELGNQLHCAHLGAKGWRTEVVASPTDLTFHPNISRIFPVKGQFTLVTGRSLRRPREAFGYDGKSLIRLSQVESNAIDAELQTTGSLAHSDKEGWNLLLQDYNLGSRRQFLWNTEWYWLDCASSGGESRVSITRTGFDPIDLFAFDSTERAIPRSERSR